MKDHSATDLAEHAAKAALAAGGIAPELVNSVIMGNVMQVSKIQQILGMFKRLQLLSLNVLIVS